MKQYTLCIPPNAAKANQMTSSDVKKKTSNIANIRIYDKEAVKHIKEFLILKTQ